MAAGPAASDPRSAAAATVRREADRLIALSHAVHGEMVRGNQESPRLVGTQIESGGPNQRTMLDVEAGLYPATDRLDDAGAFVNRHLVQGVHCQERAGLRRGHRLSPGTLLLGEPQPQRLVMPDNRIERTLAPL